MSIRPWGCTRCGSKAKSPVIETGSDEEGYVVRRRRCSACGSEWETEERPIAPGTYWSRATSRNVRRKERYHGQPRRCAKCDGRYLSGFYRRHVRESQRHAAALKPPSNGTTKPREFIRRYQRQWARDARERAA